jgi:hypothetical protein
MYQWATNYIKWMYLNYSKCPKHTNNFNSKTLQNAPKFWFLVCHLATLVGSVYIHAHCAVIQLCKINYWHQSAYDSIFNVKNRTGTLPWGIARSTVLPLTIFYCSKTTTQCTLSGFDLTTHSSNLCTYQNGEKYTKFLLIFRNGHNIYQMTGAYSKGP